MYSWSKDENNDMFEVLKMPLRQERRKDLRILGLHSGNSPLPCKDLSAQLSDHTSGN